VFDVKIGRIIVFLLSMQAIVDLVKAAEKAADKPPTKAAPIGGKGKDVVVTDDVLKRIETQVKSSDVMLFMKGTPSAPRCRFSGQAAKTLKAAGVDFSAVDVLEDPMIREGIKVYSAFPTIPQAYVFAWCSLLGVTAVRAWDLRPLPLTSPYSSPSSPYSSCSHVFPCHDAGTSRDTSWAAATSWRPCSRMVHSNN